MRLPSEQTARERHARHIERLLSMTVLAITLIAVGAIIYLRTRPRPRPKPPAPVAVVSDDPYTVSHREVESIPTGMKQPQGIAVGPDGRLYIVGDKAINIISGHKIITRPLLDEPHCLTVGTNGILYVGVKAHIERFTLDGREMPDLDPVSPQGYITSLAYANGILWAADAGNQVVVGYNADGDITTTLGKPDDKKHIPGLRVPSPHLDVAPGPHGTLWISNPGLHLVELYTAGGAFQRSWGSESMKINGFCGCCNPTDLAILADGRIVTSEKGKRRVKLYRPDGTLVSVVAEEKSFPKEGTGLDLAVDNKDRIYVLDPGARKVRIFVPKNGGQP